jgi:hypothetical protein
MQEKLLYKSRTIQAIQNPTEYMSIIIDGMNTCLVPMKLPKKKGIYIILCLNNNFKFFILASTRVDRLKLYVHGLINHGLHKRELYGSYDHWSHGSNFVCSILHQHLTKLQTEIPLNKWPHTLYLQVDNCWRENKNKTMIAYLGLLIKYGWFKEIFMYSLPPGHTHEDIDQMFSTWNVHYWKKGLQSVNDISQFINWAYSNPETRPTFKMIEYCYNIKDWIKSNLTKFTGYSEFRSFKLISEVENVALYYKVCSTRALILTFF